MSATTTPDLAARLSRFDPETVDAILKAVEIDHAIVPHDRAMDRKDREALGRLLRELHLQGTYYHGGADDLVRLRRLAVPS